MVQSSSFAPDRFSSWRKGYGFGKSARDYLSDPSIVRTGRCSPASNRFFSCSPFAKKTWEVGQQSTLGIGDRPDYSKLTASGQYFASPVTYFPDTSAAKRDVTYKNMTLKGRLREFDHVESGPGPKYNTRPEAGSGLPSISIKGRYLEASNLQPQPGPGVYETRSKPGSSLPSIVLKGRDKRELDLTQKSPGPGQYNIRSDFTLKLPKSLK